MKLLRTAIQLLILSFFAGLIWYLFLKYDEKTKSHLNGHIYEDQENFLYVYEFDKK